MLISVSVVGHTLSAIPSDNQSFCHYFLLIDHKRLMNALGLGQKYSHQGMFTYQRSLHNANDTNGTGEILFTFGRVHILKVFP